MHSNSELFYVSSYEQKSVYVVCRCCMFLLLFNGQQDGAPIHYARVVCEFLDSNFPGWIGQQGAVEWSARSPDITPCDFGVQGLLKDRVYSRHPRTLEDLRLLSLKKLTSAILTRATLEGFCSMFVRGAKKFKRLVVVTLNTSSRNTHFCTIY